mmetsp:Transcript_52259/g.119223  ORF Transcript_52259/g.119223 Transcript_52259/m.119223 type:complete len:308 (-) Transcript_52259:1198-2121(-)
MALALTAAAVTAAAATAAAATAWHSEPRLDGDVFVVEGQAEKFDDVAGVGEDDRPDERGLRRGHDARREQQHFRVSVERVDVGRRPEVPDIVEVAPKENHRGPGHLCGLALHVFCEHGAPMHCRGAAVEPDGGLHVKPREVDREAPGAAAHVEAHAILSHPRHLGEALPVAAHAAAKELDNETHRCGRKRPADAASLPSAAHSLPLLFCEVDLDVLVPALAASPVRDLSPYPQSLRAIVHWIPGCPSAQQFADLGQCPAGLDLFRCNLVVPVFVLWWTKRRQISRPRRCRFRIRSRRCCRLFFFRVV